jgi:ABC-type Zn uptake system ZnuABC Zn-binding protein ZnuA
MVTRALAGAAALALLAAACGSADRAASDAPVLHVATGLYPLAAAVSDIGGSSATVVNVVPPGQDPRTFRLPAAAAATVRSAGLVVEEGGGFQPSFESAASGARRVVALHDLPGTSEPYPWLDPTAMLAVVDAIVAAMARADPPAAGAFRANARGLTAEVRSTGIDYESTLGVCPRRAIVTADDAFAGLARRYGLVNRDLGVGRTGAGASVAAGVAAVRSTGATTVYDEPWMDGSTVRAVAAAAHVKVRSLDTLLGAPPGGWPARATYIQLLESNLGALSRGLGCPDTGTGIS